MCINVRKCARVVCPVHGALFIVVTSTKVQQSVIVRLMCNKTLKKWAKIALTLVM